jgi:hypothetical protein
VIGSPLNSPPAACGDDINILQVVGELGLGVVLKASQNYQIALWTGTMLHRRFQRTDRL